MKFFYELYVISITEQSYNSAHTTFADYLKINICYLKINYAQGSIAKRIDACYTLYRIIINIARRIFDESENYRQTT